jgi:uncharacterized protein (DUF4415 family)
MKQPNTSKPFFSPEQVAAALAAAPESQGVLDESWRDGIVSHSLPELREKLRRRGPQKEPVKVPTTIRFDPDVLAALKSSGRGWQTRVNDAMREWIKTHASS